MTVAGQPRIHTGFPALRGRAYAPGVARAESIVLVNTGYGKGKSSAAFGVMGRGWARATPGAYALPRSAGNPV